MCLLLQYVLLRILKIGQPQKGYRKGSIRCPFPGYFLVSFKNKSNGVDYLEIFMGTQVGAKL